MPSYNAGVIQKYAAKLYKRANTIILQYTIVLGTIGAAGGFFVGTSLDKVEIGTIVGCAIGATFGYSIGTQRAFVLKLLAQQALCQVQIERNTRRDGEL